MGEHWNLPNDGSGRWVAEDTRQRDPRGSLPAASLRPFEQGAFFRLLHRPPRWLACQDVLLATDNTDRVHLIAVVEPVPEVSAARDSQDSRMLLLLLPLLWVSRDNIGYTWKAVGMIEDHIPAASSSVGKGNIHMPMGWGDISWEAFDLANRPAAAVGEDKAAHNLMPVRAAGGMAQPGNIHMDNQQPEQAEKGIYLVEQHLVAEPYVVISPWGRPGLETQLMGVVEEDISDLFHKNRAPQLCPVIFSPD